uniref:TIP41-like protein n=1 Tax=Styela clava TaxID=7725 RepID=UPI00193954C1|nr:TIP41-like protein [Styela clava]
MAARAGTPIGRNFQEFHFGPWTVSAKKGPILKSDDAETLSRELELPQIPEMTFGQNAIKISHTNKFSIEFNAIDALRLVDNKRDLMKVAAAKEWIESRKDCEYIHQTVKPFDWTYSTNYKGTIIGEPEHVKVEETEEKINLEKLKVREKIAFFEQAILFEDELADHGCAELSVKMRVMPSCFFVLMRFFLRVDGVLARTHDTRLYHEGGTNYLIREYSEKECMLDGSNIPASALTDSHAIDKYLSKKTEILHKLVFDANVTNISQTSSPLSTTST